MKIFDAAHAGDEKQKIEENDCEALFPSGTKFCTDRVIVEACKGPLKSMSMFAFEGSFAKSCECDSTGSDSSICDKYWDFYLHWFLLSLSTVQLLLLSLIHI
mgnify:CR=1 FL=1